MASVSYRIGGTYDSSAVKKAKNDFESLGDSVKKITGIVKGFAVIKVAQSINKVASATKGVFLEQNTALNKFTIAISKTNINLDKMNALKDKLSRNNFIDGDSLNNATALGIELGLTEEQLEKCLTAATDLSASGIMPLNDAMKNLALSFNGNVTGLAKINPQLKNLTKEALANGKAVDIVAASYNGFADAMQNSFSGRESQFNNSIGDLKASIGSIFESIGFEAKGKLLQPLQAVTDWIVNNRNYIINFILHLPAIIKTALNGIFTPEFFTTLGTNIYTMLKVSITEGFKLMATLIDTTLSNISNGLYAIFEDTKLGTLIKNVLSGNGGLDQIERQKKANQILQSKGINAMQSLSLSDAELNALGLERVGGKNSKTYAAKRESINFGTEAIIKNIDKLANQSSETGKTIKSAFGNFWTDLVSTLDTNGTIEAIKDILGQDLPEELKEALEGLKITASPSTTSDISNEDKKQEKQKMNPVFDTLMGGTGELGALVQSIFKDGIWGAIATILGKILTRIEAVSPIFDYFMNIITNIFDLLINEDSGLIGAIERMLQPFLDGFNAVKQLLSGIIDIVIGIINILTPIFEILTMILNKVAPIVYAIFEVIALVLNAIGSIIQMFEPVIAFILDFFAPIFEFINRIIRAIYSVIARIINVIIDIYNFLAWKRVGHVSETMQESSSLTGYEKFTPDLSSYITASGSNGGSASYTAAKDIYLNVTFDRSFVNGDGRDIALMIRDEIKNAERLGY